VAPISSDADRVILLSPLSTSSQVADPPATIFHFLYHHHTDHIIRNGTGHDHTQRAAALVAQVLGIGKAGNAL
jgi:hypothetical protein